MSARHPATRARHGLVELDEADARRLCLLRACEAGAPDEALWSPEDTAWASRAAEEAMAAGATSARSSTGGEAADSAAQWLAQRARHAERRILPRRTALASVYARRWWSWRWLTAAASLGLLLGAAADTLGAGQHINLMAAPLWAVVLWNLLVYAAVAWAALRGGAGARAQGPLRRAVQGWLGGRAAPDSPGALTAEQHFAALWASASAPLAALRATLLLHVAALALGLGLIAGLYARALVLDYRVTWQSTLLDAPQVHTLLTLALAPASALTGWPVPGEEAVAALRVGPSAHGTAEANPAAVMAGAASSSAAWLHLLAATLVAFVVVPRGLLALGAAIAAHRRARRLALPMGDFTTLRLLQGRHRGPGAGAVVQAWPHGFAPPAASTLALRSALAAAFGEGVDLQVAPSVAYGDEDANPPGSWPPSSPLSTTSTPRATALRLAWFELAATPEPDAQGRFAARLAGGADGPVPAAPHALPASPLLMLIDEASYSRRMGAASPRLPERRRAWQKMAEEAGLGIAFVDLDAAARDASTAAATLQAAVQRHPQ